MRTEQEINRCLQNNIKHHINVDCYTPQQHRATQADGINAIATLVIIALLIALFYYAFDTWELYQKKRGKGVKINANSN